MVRAASHVSIGAAGTSGRVAGHGFARHWWPLTSSQHPPRPEPEPPPLPGRHLHWQLVRRRPQLVRRGSVVALLAVVGPGVLAGLSDDDPAGITTYSILGAEYGYRLLWVLALSTAALIVFHELGARMGIVTGKGLLALVRERFGSRAADGRPRALWWSPISARSRRVRRRGGRDSSCSAASAAT